MHKHRQRFGVRRGFTLVELLVVIAIIGILVALLLPAIQAARESARRSQCQNNLKNIGLGIANFESTHRVFPTGGLRYLNKGPPRYELEENIENGKPLGVKRQGLGWAYQILPFIEEGAAHQLTTTQGLGEVVVPIYVCPSRRQASSTYSTAFGLTIATLDYAGAVPCTYTNYLRTVRHDPRTGVPFTEASFTPLARSFFGGGTNGDPGINRLYDGVITRSSWLWQNTDTTTGKQVGRFLTNVPGLVKVAHILDGTSKTLMIAEKYVRNDNYQGGASYNSDDRGWTDGWDADLMRSSCFSPISDSDPIGWAPAVSEYFSDGIEGGFPFGGHWNVLHFGSAHTSGINTVFADGSVHAISYDIDVVVFNSLGSRNGEEPTPSDAWN